MRKIRTKIFIQILIPMLTIYLLIMGGAIRYLGESFLDDALNQKRSAIENVTRGLDDWLLSRVSEVLQLSRIPLFHYGSRDQVSDYLRDWRETLSFLYDELYLVDPDGTWESATGNTGRLEDRDFLTAFFEEGRLFTYAGPHRYLGNIFARHFVIGAPVFDKDGRPVQILTATVSLTTLDRVFGFFTFEDFDSWMVVNPEAMIIIHQDAGMSGKSEAASYGRVFLEDGEWGDDQVFVRFMRNGWKLVGFIESDSLMTPFRQAYTLVIGLASVMVLLVVLMILGLSAAVSHPINELTAGVHRIMSGDYNLQIESRTSDELAELADSFNRLASRMTTLRTDDRFSFIGHVAARMAHELRKPLHVIQLAAKALEQDDAERGRYLDIINEEIASADRFVGEILSFSHDESLDRQPFSPENLMSRVVDKYRLVAGACGIIITQETLTSIPEIYMDVMRMEEVFGNLIQNAVDSICEYGRFAETDRRIRVTIADTGNNEIRIDIADRGAGFDEELIDRMFDPYFTTREKGTGLGLSISYRILMAHGARISLANAESGGGVVTIVFPI